MRRLAQTLVLTLGLGLFAWFVANAETAQITAAFTKLGAGSLLIPLAYLPVYFFDTLGWYYSFPADCSPRLSFAAAARVRLAGEAVNNVVPAAMLGGEPVKAYLAIKRGVAKIPAVQSVVVAKTTMTLAQVLLLVIAALCISGSLPPNSPVHRAMLVVTAVAAAVVVAMFWLQRRGMFNGALALVRRLGLRFHALETREAHLLELDRTIVAFYRHDRLRFFLSTSAHLVGWIAGMLEVMLISHLVGIAVTWQEALAVEAFASVAKAIGAFAPGSIGVQESGIVVLFRMFGLPEVLGITYAILRRGRELLYVALGWLSLMSEETTLAGLAQRVRAQTEGGR